MDPFGAGAALHCIAPPGHISSANKVGKDGARVGINVTAHQEKKKNEETKTGKKRTGEKKKRKQRTDFEEAVCCPSPVVQGAAQRKNEGECPG